VQNKTLEERVETEPSWPERSVIEHAA